MVRKLVILGCVLIHIAGGASAVVGAESIIRDKLPTNWHWSPQTQGPMCGVYAVCRALTLSGAQVDPCAFWKVEFVGSSKGSTPEELIAAIRAQGAEGTFRSRLTVSEIYSLGVPVIANVRVTPDAKEFNHWVCAQPTRQGLLIYDGPEPGRIVNPAEFLATWSGLGISVSKSKLINVRFYVTRLLAMGSLFIATCAVLSWGKNADDRNSKSMIALGRVGGATLLSLTLGSLLYGLGPGHLAGVSVAAAPFRHVWIKPGSLDDVLNASKMPNSLVMDARMESDYARGTINNAVNIPVHASHQEIRAFLKDVPKSVPIVVFCQSKSCGYDDVVARALVQLGFDDVTVSDLGYAEYQQRMAENRETAGTKQ